MVGWPKGPIVSDVGPFGRTDCYCARLAPLLDSTMLPSAGRLCRFTCPLGIIWIESSPARPTGNNGGDLALHQLKCFQSPG